MISRRKGREFAMQLLYAMEVGKEAIGEALAGLSEDPAHASEAKEYGEKLARMVLDHQAELDECIRGASDNWDMDRIAVIDKIILRCAAAELRYFGDVPARVAINEALDIAKKFSTADSGRFVNGVLDSIAKQFSNINQRIPQDAK